MSGIRENKESMPYTVDSCFSHSPNMIIGICTISKAGRLFTSFYSRPVITIEMGLQFGSYISSLFAKNILQHTVDSKTLILCVSNESILIGWVSSYYLHLQDRSRIRTMGTNNNSHCIND